MKKEQTPHSGKKQDPLMMPRLQQLADEFETSVSSLRRRMKEFGIPTHRRAYLPFEADDIREAYGRPRLFTQSRQPSSPAAQQPSSP